MTITRRQFCQMSLFGAAAMALGKPVLAANEPLPPIRTVTRGPKHHWFGYYDKLQFDPSSRYALCNQVDFEHRSPLPGDLIAVGMVDLEDGDRWTELGTSYAWNWQQGCMLQWLPGSKSEIIWNDRTENGFVSHVLDVKSKEKRTLPQPVYCVSPDAKYGIAPDFRRLNDVRPGYGYCGPRDPYFDETLPTKSGITLVDLQTGKSDLILSIADVAKFGEQLPDMVGAKHWFNHLLFSPNGERFIFLHRWRPVNDPKRFRTRMLTAKVDGSDLYVVDPSGATSHFIWRDPQHILAWSQPAEHPKGFYLFKDKTPIVEAVGPDVMTTDGHCTYLPGNQWILNDTYPDRERLQHPYLYEIATGRRVPLGHFHSPPQYQGEWRCDTHPRFSPNGKLVAIDSPHNGQGRQLHVIDVSSIVG